VFDRIFLQRGVAGSDPRQLHQNSLVNTLSGPSHARWIDDPEFSRSTDGPQGVEAR
jgi:hypothetical protein